MKNMMKGILIIFFFLLSIRTQGQVEGSMKDVTLKTLRNYRNNLNAIEDSPVVNDLLSNVNKVISIAKNIDDSTKLKDLNEYCKLLKGKEQWNNGKENLQNINEDLSLKISYFDSIGSLNLENSGSFFKRGDLAIKVFIDGKIQNEGAYRIYWAPNFGQPIDYFIKNNVYQGFANQLTNPYILQLTVPSIIILWLENVSTHQKYKCDAKAYKIMPNLKTLDVNFSIF